MTFMEENKEKKSGFLNVRLVTLILILITLIGIVITALIKLPNVRLPGSKETSEDLPIDKEHNTSGLLIPKEVYVFIGTVSKIGTDSIMINAPSHSNYLYQDEELRVLIDDNTSIIKYILPNKIPANTKVITTQQEDITIADIKIGDRVEVHSADNLKGQLIFKANLIKVKRN